VFLTKTVATCALTMLPLSALLGACSLTESNKSDDKASDGPIAVTSSDDDCALSSTKAGSGTLKFTVKNTGSKVTEFYLYAEDGKRIVGEVENIGPGLTRELVVSAKPASAVGVKVNQTLALVDGSPHAWFSAASLSFVVASVVSSVTWLPSATWVAPASSSLTGAAAHTGADETPIERSAAAATAAARRTMRRERRALGSNVEMETSAG